MKMKYEETALTDQEFIAFFNKNGRWLIRKVPNTKDQYIVVTTAQPPDAVKEVYGIKND
tara:strand:- start:271 stop:447 length:177 start_codon:yes stop_codon:yes gene_type:complete